MRFVQRRGAWIGATVGLAAALAGAPAASAPLDAAQRRCLVQSNRTAAGVVEARWSDTRRCLARAARGREPDAQACGDGDPRGKVALARARLEARLARRCTAPLPPFGATDASALGDAAVEEAAALGADLFGADLGAAVVARDDARADAACQAAAAAESGRLVAALLDAAGKAEDAALAGRGGTAPAEDPAGLAAALDAALAPDAEGNPRRAAAALAKRVGARCAGGDLAALFPGPCADAADAAALAACAEGRARCRACRALARFGELPLDCDALDDALANASCASPVGPPWPALLASTPEGGAAGFGPARWLALEFAGPFPAERVDELTLACDGAAQAIRTEPGAGSSLFVVPAAGLPADASCELRWPDGGLLAFATGAATPVVLYDRTDPFLIAPFPDDALLVEDATTASGKRIQLEPPPFDGLLGVVAYGISVALARRDGFSPAQPLVFALSHPLEPASVPLDEAASLAPGAALRLLDVDPASPSYGERIPFTARLRSDAAGGAGVDHSLLVWPAVDLRAGGRYAFVVTRDAQAVGGLPFGPSGFFEQVLAASSGPAAAVQRARDALAPALAALASAAEPPLAPDDLALAVSLSIRSVALDPSDWVAVKEHHLASPPPVLVPGETETLADEVRMRGTVELPLFVANGSLTEVTRDETTGAPVSLASEAVPFALRIPTGVPTPVPVVIYQHGSPGSPDEVFGGTNGALVDAGYAVLGIQDVTNRRFGEDTANQTTQIVGRLAFAHALPLTNFQTHADMLGLLRAIQGMGVPGNFPEIDPTRILYRGVSFGAHHSLGFLPLAPEVTAAVSHVGSGRLYQANLHQLDWQDLLGGILAALPGARPRDVIAGLAAIQNEQDRDDGYLLARNLYEAPLAIAGLADTTPPSLLWIEGIGDSLVPNVATRATTRALGIPSVRELAQASPVLVEADAPLSENVAPGVTAGHFQYAPATTPGCVATGETEGHFCAQGAAEVRAQMLHFFATALAGAAEIVDPLP